MLNGFYSGKEGYKKRLNKILKLYRHIKRTVDGIIGKSFYMPPLIFWRFVTVFLG